MMRIPVFDLNGKKIKEIELPPIFKLEIRPDIIRRTYISQLTARIQPQGRDPLAGLRTSAESWGTGHGVARVPRFKGRGYPAASRAARAVMTVGGVKTKAPRSWKRIRERVNQRERKLATISAIAATSRIDLVSSKHRIDDIKQVPLILSDELEGIRKTSKLYTLMVKLGLKEELDRNKKRFEKIRAGKGKMRGRVRQRSKGPLIIYLNEGSYISRSARNIPGVETVALRNLSVMHLAPGGIPGRLTIWTEGALNSLQEVMGIV